MTVKEFMQKHKHENKSFYLIPRLLKNQTFSEPYYLFGHSVSNIGSVNENIINKEVTKHWRDSDEYVIIWKNN